MNALLSLLSSLFAPVHGQIDSASLTFELKRTGAEFAPRRFTAVERTDWARPNHERARFERLTGRR